jgi:predicted GNAT family N-acyltransferase
MKEQAIEITEAFGDQEMKEVFAIRQKVFVEEQEVDPELEYDEFEESSQHYLATVSGVPAGTARWRFTSSGVKLERFAVLPEYRGKGVASALISTILGIVPPDKKIYLHSQVQVCGLYSRFGFKEEGEMFEEAGIQHYKMVLNAISA